VLTVFTGDTILIDVEYQGVSGTVFPFAVFAGAAMDIVVSGSGKVAWHDDAADRTGNFKVNEQGWTPDSTADGVAIKCQKEYTAPADQTLTVHGAGGAHLASPTTGSGRVLLRVYRVKI